MHRTSGRLDIASNTLLVKAIAIHIRAHRLDQHLLLIMRGRLIGEI